MGLSSWLKKLGLSQGLAEDGFEPIDGTTTLDTVLERSHEQPVFIYKHSPICSVSTFAYRQVVGFLSAAASKPIIYFVDVLGARPVSNDIASRLDVVHQSPQVILIRSGEVRWHGSHGDIRQEALQRALAEAS